MKRGKKRGFFRGVKPQDRTFFKDQLARLNLGLENCLSSEIGLLSGGQRQAITLLMATLQRPELILLDEHTAALDPATSKTVMELTEKLITSRISLLLWSLMTWNTSYSLWESTDQCLASRRDRRRYPARGKTAAHSAPIISVVQTKQRHGIKRRSSTFIFIIRKRLGTKNERPPSSFFSFLLRFCFMYQPLFLRKLFCSLLLPDRMDGKELDAMTTKDKVLQLLKKTPDFLPEKSWHSNWKFPLQVFWKPSKNWKRQAIVLSTGLQGIVTCPLTY